MTDTTLTRDDATDQEKADVRAVLLKQMIQDLDARPDLLAESNQFLREWLYAVGYPQKAITSLGDAAIYTARSDRLSADIVSRDRLRRSVRALWWLGAIAMIVVTLGPLALRNLGL